MLDLYDLQRYDLELRSAIQSIFSGASIDAAGDGDMRLVFARADWHVIGLPLRLDRAPTMASPEPVEPSVAEFHDAWVALFETLRAKGEHELIVAARPGDTVRPAASVVAAACAFDRREIGAAVNAGGFLAYEEHLVFGRSLAWGQVIHCEDFTILGGTAELIGAYVAAAGGIEAVRRRFENAIDDQLRSKSGKSDWDRFADRIVRAMRWPP